MAAEAFKAATHFAVNILASDQMNLSRHFGQPGFDLFESVPWKPGASGAPLIEGAVATLECRLAAEYEGGDHLIMLGEVERYRRYDRDVLLFVQGRYGVAVDHPEAAPPAQASAATSIPAQASDDFLVSLMYKGSNALSAAVEEGRRAEGLTAEQSRVLFAIESSPGRSLESLMPELFLGLNAVQGATGALRHAGFIVRDASGALRTTPNGSQRLGALLERARAIEAQQLQGVSAADIAATRRVCKALIERGRAQLDSAGRGV